MLDYIELDNRPRVALQTRQERKQKLLEARLRTRAIKLKQSNKDYLGAMEFDSADMTNIEKYLTEEIGLDKDVVGIGELRKMRERSFNDVMDVMESEEETPLMRRGREERSFNRGRFDTQIEEEIPSRQPRRNDFDMEMNYDRRPKRDFAYEIEERDMQNDLIEERSITEEKSTHRQKVTREKNVVKKEVKPMGLQKILLTLGVFVVVVVVIVLLLRVMNNLNNKKETGEKQQVVQKVENTKATQEVVVERQDSNNQSKVQVTKDMLQNAKEIIVIGVVQGVTFVESNGQLLPKAQFDVDGARMEMDVTTRDAIQLLDSKGKKISLTIAELTLKNNKKVFVLSKLGR